METTTAILFALGLGLLIAGAEALVRGASGLAARFGIPPLVVGLTVVAYGTSAPEMAVSMASALKGQGDLAFGNVVGSNIFNVLFILGVSAAITPLFVTRQLLRLDVPVMIGVAGLALLLALDGSIGRLDGALLLFGAVAYTLLLIRLARRDPAPPPAADARAPLPLPLQLLLIAAGLGALVLGSRWLVAGAVAVARWLGLSELVIGLTIVAAGTSLPEVASSIVAALRGEREIAVGNVVGSNIFNVLAVLGLSGAVAPDGVIVAPAALRFDVPVMLAASVACLPIFFTRCRISRWEGALFLATYAAYTAYLVLDAQGHDALPAYSAVLNYFALPLVAVTLGIVTFRALGRGDGEVCDP
jgi:cation:H+ antiporter